MTADSNGYEDDAIGGPQPWYLTVTEGGFGILKFADEYGKACLLEQDTGIDMEGSMLPGSSYVWLGTRESSMLLGRRAIEELVAYLHKWLASGTFTGLPWELDVMGLPWPPPPSMIDEVFNALYPCRAVITIKQQSELTELVRLMNITLSEQWIDMLVDEEVLSITMRCRNSEAMQKILQGSGLSYSMSTIQGNP